MMRPDESNYSPRPIDLSGIILPEEMNAVAESLAKNVHETWARDRMAEGWTYGPDRNDELKQTPCLVPYEDLPEAEKAYDRNTALGTLKFIISQGFTIFKQEKL